MSLPEFQVETQEQRMYWSRTMNLIFELENSKCWNLVSRAIGTVVGRKTTADGREYTRLWIYVPNKLSQDTAFRFRVGDPYDIEMDTKTGELTIRGISPDEAIHCGWSRRKRFKKE
jgi:hypothetical protein